MGYAKLDVWFRDTQGRLIQNIQADYDWVGVWRVGEYTQGTGVSIGAGAIKQASIPAGEAHVQLEVPPGAYIVQGHFCDPFLADRHLSNSYTDRTMVIANCDQIICVNLLVPEFAQCVRGIQAAANAAIRVRPELRPHLAVVLSTLYDAADIRTNEVLMEANKHLELAKKINLEVEIANAKQLISILTALK